MRRVTCKSVTIPAGYYDVSNEKLFSGLLPTRIIVGLVRNDAFSGSRTHNPFNFQNFGLTEIAVYTDGQQHGPGIKPLKIDYTNKRTSALKTRCSAVPENSSTTKATTSADPSTPTDMLCMLSTCRRTRQTTNISTSAKRAAYVFMRNSPTHSRPQ